MAHLLCLLLVSSTIAIATALTNRELDLIRDYNRRTTNAACSRLMVTSNGFYSQLTSRGLPNHAVYQTNQNSIREKSYFTFVSSTPQIQRSGTCLPTDSPIGFAINGIPLYSPLSNYFTNTVQGSGALVQDGCHGRVSSSGLYHYPSPPALDCLFSSPQPDEHLLIGVALDGVPIYYHNSTDYQRAITEASLDECRGKNTSEGYRYYASDQFPYFMGCFRGHVGVFYNSADVYPTSCQVMRRSSICSCHILSQSQGVPPPGVDNRNPPGSSPGGERVIPPPPSPPPRVTVALIYTMQNASHGEARMPYTCQVELNRNQWCDPNAARPKDCGLVQEPVTRTPPTSTTTRENRIADRGRTPYPDGSYGPGDPGSRPRRPGDNRPETPFPQPPGSSGGSPPGGRPFVGTGRAVQGPSGEIMDERSRCECDCTQCGRGVRFTPGRSINSTNRIAPPPPAPFHPGTAMPEQGGPSTNAPIFADGRRNPDGTYGPARGPPRPPGDNRPETPFPLPPSSGPIGAPRRIVARPGGTDATASPSTNAPNRADGRRSPPGSYGPPGGQPRRPGPSRPGTPVPVPSPPTPESPGNMDNMVNTVEREGECLCDCLRCMLGSVYRPGNNNIYNNMPPPAPAPFRPSMPGPPSLTPGPSGPSMNPQRPGMHMMSKAPAPPPKLYTVKIPLAPAPISSPGGEERGNDVNTRAPNPPGSSEENRQPGT